MPLKEKFPLLAEFTARRVVDADEISTLVAAASQPGQNQGAILAGFLQGLEGRSDLSAPPQRKSVYLSLSKNQETAPLALAISQQFGDSQAAAKYTETVKNRNAPVSQRKNAIRALATKQRPELPPVLPELWDQEELRLEAITGFGCL